MRSAKLFLTQNYLEIEQANKLGIPPPAPNTTLSKFLFRAPDIKRAVIDGDNIFIQLALLMMIPML